MAAFNKYYAGKYFNSAGGTIYNYDGKYFRGVSISVNDTGVSSGVYLTGWSRGASNGTVMWQTTTGQYISFEDDWKEYANTSSLVYNQSQAQQYVNQIIANNKIILQNNILCARYAKKLDVSQKDTLFVLQKRLEERNDSLLKEGLCSGMQQQPAYGYQYIDSYLTSFMNTGGIGIAVTIIVVTAVVVASMATAAYFCYKYYAEQSEQDVKYSKDLTRALQAKLTEEEYQQLLTETKGIVTKQRIKSQIGTSIGWIKWGLLGVGIFAIYKTVEPEIKKRLKK